MVREGRVGTDTLALPERRVGTDTLAVLGRRVGTDTRVVRGGRVGTNTLGVLGSRLGTKVLADEGRLGTDVVGDGDLGLIDEEGIVTDLLSLLGVRGEDGGD